MKPRAMSEAESESFGFINFDGRNPGVCWHLNESLERCHEPDTGTTARRCAKHAKGRDHEIQREREKKRWLQQEERRVRAGLDANKRGYKVKKHTWAVSKLAESTVTGELFPVGWTCTECGLVKRMKPVNRLEYTMPGSHYRTHAGECCATEAGVAHVYAYPNGHPCDGGTCQQGECVP